MTVRVSIKGKMYYVYGSAEKVATKASESGIDLDSVIPAKACTGIRNIWPFEALADHLNALDHDQVDLGKLWDAIALAAKMELAGFDVNKERVNIPHLDYVCATPLHNESEAKKKFDYIRLDFKAVSFASKAWQMGWTVYFSNFNEILYANYKQKCIFLWVGDEELPLG